VRSAVRLKTIVVVACGTTVLAGLLVLPLRALVLRSFLRLEQESALRDLGRARDAIRDDVAQLHATARDYACWDDTYAFLGGDPAQASYPALNFVDATFAQNRLSLLLLVTPGGKIVFSNAYDLARRAERPVPPAETFFRGPGDALLPLEADGRQGLIRMPDGPLMIAAYPVLTSERTGPPRGTLIMGRALDDAEIARLANALRLSISLTPAGSVQPPEATTTRALDEHRLAAFAVLEDVSGTPLQVLRLELPRDIYRRGVTDARWLLGSALLAGLVLGIAILVLLDRLVVREAFGRYVSEDVARTVLARPGGAMLGGETREVTILFSDVRNYSTIAEKLPPGEVVDVLNEYFGAMSEVIDREGGCVIEFLGDAILAVFGAPGELVNHADRAVRAALQMRVRGAQLNESWARNGKARLWQQCGIAALSSRIGVHSGRVVAGNLGSKARMKYAVIGDAVNAASRVENLNNALGTDLLFTEEVRAGLSPELLARSEDAGEHAVKGRERPVHVFTLRGPPA